MTISIHHPFRATLLVALPVLLLGADAGAQNHFGAVAIDPIVQNILASCSLDTMQRFDKELCGLVAVPVNGSPVVITSRMSGTVLFQQAAQHVFDIFSRYGLNPTLENNATPFNKINVVATLPGRRNAQVIICGHFDDANTSCPGADDNASGTSAVLEAARVLRTHDFDYTIRFIAFGGEEQGMRGSAAYTTSHATDSVLAVINCDMIMWDGNADRRITLHSTPNTGTAFSSDLADFLIDVNNAYGLTGDPHKVIPGSTSSDHSSFWAKSRSAVLVIEDYPGDFNPYYHSPSDSWQTANNTENQAIFNACVRLAVASVAQLAVPLQATPVELSSFTATAERDRAVQLRWTTESESANRGFTVQRGVHGRDGYDDIAFVPGAGSTTVRHDYEFNDHPAGPDAFEYRLRQEDLDGAVSYSPVVRVLLANDDEAFALRQVYPNPVAASTRITWSLDRDMPVRLAVYDGLGRLVRTLEDHTGTRGVHTTTFNAAGLPPGLYAITLATPEGQQVKSLVIRN